MEQEVRSQHAMHQISLLHPPSSNLDRKTSLHDTDPYRERSHSFDCSYGRSLGSHSEQLGLASSPSHVTSLSSSSIPTFPVLHLRSSPQVPERRGWYDCSTASNPDHSPHHLGDEGNGSDAGNYHSSQSSLASSIHIHLHLPQSHSSEALSSAASNGGGGFTRSRLHSAPEQVLQQVLQNKRPHPQAGISSVPSHMDGYQQSDNDTMQVTCSSEQLLNSLSASEELVSPGEMLLTKPIDRQQKNGGQSPGEDRERCTSDNILTSDSPRASSVEYSNGEPGGHFLIDLMVLLTC